MKKFCVVILILLLWGATKAQSGKSLEYKLNVALTATSESNGSDDHDLNYAGLGWKVSNNFYLGSLNKWKATVGVERTKSVTDIDSRFDLNQANNINSNSARSLFLKTGVGGRILIHYAPELIIYTEGTINYNMLLQRDTDLVLQNKDLDYDMINHFDGDIGIFFQHGKWSLGLVYTRNIDNISVTLSDLKKNVVSLDLGYRIL